MEDRISAFIVRRYFEKFSSALSLDVAFVGAGPSALVAAHDLAREGFKVALFESKLAPGGGIWGGGMLFNEVVVQSDALPILDDFGIRHESADEGFYTCDAVELASGLIFGARRAGALLFNAIKVEDVAMRDSRVIGLVINWTPVVRLEMHVDPLTVLARAVVDATGHPSEIAALVSRKANLRLETPTGSLCGERPMWMERAEVETVVNTRRLCPGLYVCGMAANNVQGGFRMGPVFGGMLKSGRKLAQLIAADLT